MANPTPNKPSIYKKDQIMEGHSYDGIQEYDNMMPGWWAAIFAITVVWAAIYYIVYLGKDSYGEDLQASLTELQEMRSKAAATGFGADVSEAKLKGFTDDKSMATKGQTTYTQYCAACHGAAGGGGIGPNLTDAFWIHGGARMDIYNTITKGVTEKGMPAWDAQVAPADRAAIIAYIYSVAGTNPAGAKAPQGEKFDPASIKLDAPAAAPAPAATTPAPAGK